MLFAAHGVVWKKSVRNPPPFEKAQMLFAAHGVIWKKSFRNPPPFEKAQMLFAAGGGVFRWSWNKRDKTSALVSKMDTQGRENVLFVYRIKTSLIIHSQINYI